MVSNRNLTAGRTALVALLLGLALASAAHAQAPRIDQATLEEPGQKTRARCFAKCSWANTSA